MQKEQSPPPIETLQKLADIESNSHCFYCGKPSKQWVQLSHAIFLCLGCAADFRQHNWVTRIKSLNLDPWTQGEIKRLEKGGNQRFATYLTYYGLKQAQVRLICACKASAYYRDMLDGKAEGEKPTVEEGRQISLENLPFYEMKASELLQSAKEKALWLGTKRKQMGELGYNKLQSGAADVSEKVKQLFSYVKSQEKGKSQQCPTYEKQ